MIQLEEVEKYRTRKPPQSYHSTILPTEACRGALSFFLVNVSFHGQTSAWIWSLLSAIGQLGHWYGYHGEGGSHAGHIRRKNSNISLPMLLWMLADRRSISICVGPNGRKACWLPSMLPRRFWAASLRSGLRRLWGPSQRAWLPFRLRRRAGPRPKEPRTYATDQFWGPSRAHLPAAARLMSLEQGVVM